MSSPPRSVVVIGVGNRFRGDDAVGPVVVDRLTSLVPSEVQLVESEGDPMALIGWWQHADLAVVVDGVVAGGKPGTVYRFNGDRAIPTRFFTRSTHLLGLGEAVELARSLGRLPHHLVLFGVEVGDTGHGAELTDAVTRAGDDVVAAIVELLEAVGVVRRHSEGTNA